MLCKNWNEFPQCGVHLKRKAHLNWQHLAHLQRKFGPSFADQMLLLLDHNSKLHWKFPTQTHNVCGGAQKRWFKRAKRVKKWRKKQWTMNTTHTNRDKQTHKAVAFLYSSSSSIQHTHYQSREAQQLSNAFQWQFIIQATNGKE